MLETYDYAPPLLPCAACARWPTVCVLALLATRSICAEPHLPYAWPEKYRLTAEHDIVAIAAIDTALVIGTQGLPYLAQGVSSSSVTNQKLSHLPQACISARSMVAMDGVVLYASPGRPCRHWRQRWQVVTEQVITRKRWQAMKPETLRAWHHEGKVHRHDRYPRLYL